jgi:hypothetical protein
VTWHVGSHQRGAWYPWPALRVEAYRGYPPQRARTINLSLSLLRWFVQAHIEL